MTFGNKPTLSAINLSKLMPEEEINSVEMMPLTVNVTSIAGASCDFDVQ